MAIGRSSDAPLTNGTSPSYKTEQANGVGHILQEVNGNGTSTRSLPSEPFGHRKRIRVAVIGAGLSGLNIFKVAEEKLKNVDLICYEKNKDVGGT